MPCEQRAVRGAVDAACAGAGAGAGAGVGAMDGGIVGTTGVGDRGGHRLSC